LFIKHAFLQLFGGFRVNLREKISMILRFVISNFLSFKDETEFNMLTGNFKIHPSHVFQRHGFEVLKAAAIYGANGAGKSNLIKAIAFFKDIIEKGSLTELPPKHKAAPEMLAKPTSFEIEFLTVSASYYYKIEINGGKILNEGLMKTALDGEDEIIFERTTDILEQQKLELNSRFLESEQDRVRKQLLEDEFLIANVPFLSIIPRLKETKMREIVDAYEWITRQLIIVFPHTKPDYILSTFIFSKQFHQFSNQLMCDFDTGIVSMDVEDLTLEAYFGKDNIKEAKVTADKLSAARTYLEVATDAIAVLKDKVPMIKKLYMTHKGTGGQSIKFELSEESDGTRRLFNYIPALYLLLFRNAVVLFDEIDQSIHSYLLKNLLKKIMDQTHSTGQIIFTVHESNLLDLGLFRQDEIWFARKDSEGRTKFNSLSEFKPRYDLDIRKGYLNGRFEAIPNMDELSNANWNKYATKESGL
jgi:AAA15 family ATPase/GTPase